MSFVMGQSNEDEKYSQRSNRHHLGGHATAYDSILNDEKKMKNIEKMIK